MRHNGEHHLHEFEYGVGSYYQANIDRYKLVEIESEGPMHLKPMLLEHFLHWKGIK